MKDVMKIIDGGVCSPKGYQAAGVHCGIKGSGKKDLALVVSDVLCNAAGVYTQNKVKGAPIFVTQDNLKNGIAKAIVCNSGNANTCAPNGMELALQTCDLAAEAIGCNKDEIILASTGVIGEPMSIEPFQEGLPKSAKALSPMGGSQSAEAILTTDTAKKEGAVQFMIGDSLCTLGGMAKGSGMIHPNMATMLCFITGDVAIEGDLLAKALKDATDASFNQISVDGDTSTNDMVTVMTNGMAGNKGISDEGEEYNVFCENLTLLMTKLAEDIAKDGEGASKYMEVEVIGSPTQKAARAISKSVVSSSLFKAALFGGDANWGRVLCAVGYADADFQGENIDVEMESKGGKMLFCKGSAAIGFDEEKAAEILKEDEIKFIVNLNEGKESASAWGCDLTYEYVKINGEYRS